MFPASAGMNRASIVRKTTFFHVPRERGDEPLIRGDYRTQIRHREAGY